MPSYQKASYSLELDEPLGKWLKAHRHCWYDCYKTEEGLIYRDSEINELKSMLAFKESKIRDLTEKNEESKDFYENEGQRWKR